MIAEQTDDKKAVTQFVLMEMVMEVMVGKNWKIWSCFENISKIKTSCQCLRNIRC